MAFDRIPAKPTKFDAAARARFLTAYAYTGRVAHAAKSAGVTSSYIYSLRTLDDDFAMAMQEAYQLFCDALEEEAYRRAHDGVRDHMYYKGEPVIEFEMDSAGNLVFESDPDNPGKTRPKVKGHAYKLIYSDALLLAMLKRHIPGYRDKAQLDLNVTGLEGLLADIKNKSTGLPAQQLLPAPSPSEDD